MNDGDTIARTMFAVIAQGGTIDVDQLKDLVDFRHPNGLGRTFEAMLILARQAVRTVELDLRQIEQPRIKEIEKVVEKFVRREVEVRVPVSVEVLPEERVSEMVDQILGDIGAASEVAKAEGRKFGVRDLRPIIERNLR